MKQCHLLQHGWAWDCHSKWNKSDGERKMSYDMNYMWNLKTHGKIWKQHQRYWKQTCGYEGEREGGINQEMGIDIHIIVHKMCPTRHVTHKKHQTRLRNFTFTFTFLHWRSKWQHTPLFLPGEPQGQRSLVGCLLWDCIEPDTTEAT